MKLRIYYEMPKWMFGDKYWGRIIYPFIIYKAKKSAVKDYMLRHEFEHAYQIRRDGWWKYNISYIYQWIRYGYKNISYEKEAYAIQNTTLTKIEERIKLLNGEV